MSPTLIKFLAVACCMTTAPVSAAAEEQAPPATATAADAELESIEVKAKYRKTYQTCIREVPTGSILIKTVCRNRALKVAEEEATRLAFERMKSERTRRQHTQFMTE